ncbi:unnamed protein product, partial [Soboliphyme baturini]|uniref:Ig-like domain-containing protein n=1 Tax=Soboliphyme baturini TaxID=241478 RepID=A0A183IHX9_9BILA
WVVGQWEDCDVTCGGGWQIREIYCAKHKKANGESVESHKLDETYCWNQRKPVVRRACNTQRCPNWEVGEWSQCSATCGSGSQFRRVVCRQDRITDFSAAACDPRTMPSEEQKCFTGITCDDEAKRQGNLAAENFVFGADKMVFKLSPICQSQGSWLAGQWKDCSTSCGAGVRSREIHCVAFQPITQNVVILPDYECEAKVKPRDFQPCELKPCLYDPKTATMSQADNGARSYNDYRWDFGEWSQCSASCLGGLHRIQTLCLCCEINVCVISGRKTANLKCIQVSTSREVAWSNCNAKQRPANMTRECNNVPCPPKWEIGGWSECSHTCGGGVRTRQTRCIREINRTPNIANVLILSDSQCPSPKPIEQQCSVTCGAGEQSREIACEQVLIAEVKRYNPPTPCAGLQKPPFIQLCSMQATCQPENDLRESIVPKKLTSKSKPRSLTLRVGGKATLYEGTNLKIKCPVGVKQKSKILWKLNDMPINFTSKSRLENAGYDRLLCNVVCNWLTYRIWVTKNQALRLVRAKFADAGVYSCEHLKAIPLLEGTLMQHSLPSATTEVNESPNEVTHEDKTAVTLSFVGLGEEQSNQIIDRSDQEAAAGQQFDYSTPRTVEEDSPTIVQQPQKLAGGQTVDFRQVQCSITINGYVNYVNDAICIRAGFTKPHDTQFCGLQPCPEWSTGNWSTCESGRCIRFSTAVQRRQVYCQYSNGTRANDSSCNRTAKPRMKKECLNRSCVAEWRPGPWTMCSATCGEGGLQMRTVSCVWHGTHKPAGTGCENGTARPAVSRPCENQPACSPSTFTDQSTPLLKGLRNWRGWKLYGLDPLGL